MADSTVKGADALIRDLAAGAAKAEELVDVAVKGSAVELKSLTQRNATGRPGPENVTDDYVASWRDEKLDDVAADEVAWAVYSDHPGAHRLEFGFVGTDSIGRHYDAPPYPHMGPAKDATEPIFYAAMDAAARRAIDW